MSVRQDLGQVDDGIGIVGRALWDGDQEQEQRYRMMRKVVTWRRQDYLAAPEQ